MDLTEETYHQAIEAMMTRLGDIPDEDRVIVCDDCSNWMLDVEQIARNICLDHHLDPEVMITKMDVNFEPYQVPTWAAFIPEAEQLTTVPSPKSA